MYGDKMSDQTTASPEYEAPEYEAPEYDVLEIPIVLEKDADNNYLVHENLGRLEAITGIFGEASGTGNVPNDRVNLYTEEQFQDKFQIGGIGFITLERYQADSAELQPARLEMGAGTPIVAAADYMKMRLEEVQVDLEAYRNSLTQQPAELEAPVPSLNQGQ